MTTVKAAINAVMWSGLEDEVSGIPANSVVGKMIVDLLNKVESLLEVVDEPPVRRDFIEGALDQSCVWYFG